MSNADVGSQSYPVPTAEHVYTISQVSALVGMVPVETLRHWERDLGELLQPARRTGGARLYTEADVQTLCTFRQLKERGLTNAGARDEITRRRQARSEIETVEQALEAVARATRQIAQATELLDEAREFLAKNAKAT